MPDGLPQDLRVGLFAQPRTYQARIRFAHASSESDTERDVRGMSIKVSGVGGENLTPGVSDHDFILNSHPVMMVGHTKDFLDLLKAVEEGGAAQALFFVTHPRAAAVALASRQHATSHLEIPYWSTTPYLFGPGRAVKYSVRPASPRKTPLPDPLTDDYLRERLVAPSRARRSAFRVSRAVPDRRPEDADRRRERGMAGATTPPFRAVAEIRIPVQTLEGRERRVLRAALVQSLARPGGSPPARRLQPRAP